MKRPAPVIMWAVVVKSQRSSWINWITIKRLKYEAWEAYCAMYIPEHRPKLEQEKKSGQLKLTRVIIDVLK